MDYKFGHKRKYSGDELKLLKLSAETDPDRHVEKKGADSHIKFHGEQLDFLTKNISFRMKGKPAISKEMKQQHTAKIDKLEKIKIKREKQLDLAKNGIKKFNAQLSKVKNDLTPKSIVRKQADAHIKKLIKRKDEIKAKISNTKKEIQTLKKDFDIKKIKIKKTRDLKIDKTLKDRNNTALRKLQETIQKTLKETFTKKKSRLLSRKMSTPLKSEPWLNLFNNRNPAKKQWEAAKRAQEAAAKSAKRAQEAAAKAAKKAKDWNKPPPKFIIGWGDKKIINPAYDGWLMRQNMMKKAAEKVKRAQEAAKKAKAAKPPKKAKKSITKPKANKDEIKKTHDEPIKKKAAAIKYEQAPRRTMTKKTGRALGFNKNTTLGQLFKVLHNQMEHFRK